MKHRARHAVGSLSDLLPGSRLIAQVPAFGKTMEIGVFNVGGRLVAYRNVCPHAGAPVCVGKVCGTTLPGEVGQYTLAREGEILRCPWHGWEFDLLTGEHLVDEKMKLRAYDVQTGSPEEVLESFTVETEGEIVFVLV
jgi:nitrite reductase/ring-hydroxylating ferredoxin subunit